MTAKYNEMRNQLEVATKKYTTLECQLESNNSSRKAKMKTLANEKKKLEDLGKVRRPP